MSQGEHYQEFFGCTCGDLRHVLKVSFVQDEEDTPTERLFPDLFIAVLLDRGSPWRRLKNAWHYLRKAWQWDGCVAETLLSREDAVRLRDQIDRYLEEN